LAPLEVTPGPGESCSFVLAPSPATLGNPRTGVVLIHNELLPGLGPRGVSIVVAAQLADPSSYGSDVNQYGAVIHVNGSDVGPLRMTQTGSDLWSVSFTDAAFLSTQAVDVEVIPLPGPFDRIVMAGEGTCPGTCLVHLDPADGAPLGSGGAAWVRPLNGGGFTVAVVAANLSGGASYRAALQVVDMAPFATFPPVAVGGDQAVSLFAGSYTSTLVNLIPEIELMVAPEGQDTVVLHGSFTSCG
jgi:hypothetical protein